MEFGCILDWCVHSMDVSIYKSVWLHQVPESVILTCIAFLSISVSLMGQWLTLKVLVVTIDAQWEGMGDVGLARYEPALLPPCPTITVLSYSN